MARRMLLLVAVCIAVARIAAHGPDSAVPFAVRITSPLGRAIASGPIRIVAQVRGPAERPIASVRFYVDDKVIGEVKKGPPFAVDWVDENPFESRRIRAEAFDAAGDVAGDSVELPPMPITESADVLSVLLDVGVQDTDGRFITGLDAPDFTLAEDGVRQTPDLVRLETLPGVCALLVDSSQSMARRIDEVRDAATKVLRALAPRDTLIVAPFTQRLGAITGPTADEKTTLEAIASIHAGGGTAILDALIDAAALVQPAQGRRAIVLLTDGYDENSTHTVDQALAALRDARITMYVVGMGGSAGISLKGEDMLRLLARETAGMAFFPSRETELPSINDRIAQDVHNRYLISYTPTNQRIDGTWRSLSVRVNRDHVKVRVKDGYRAPAPPPVRPTLEFAITDADDRYLDVTRDDLAVIEEGTPQQIEVFQEAVAPVSIILSLDQSGSMKRAAADVVAAAQSFVGALRPEDALGVQLFSDADVLAQDLGTDRRPSSDAIGSYAPAGGTALYDAMYDALTRLSREEARRAVVVLTDGRDENAKSNGPGSRHQLDQVLERIKSTGAIVYAIGLGRQVDRGVLQRLASESGGHAYFPTDVSELPSQYARIVENLRRRYTIAYTSTHPVRDGAWRRVDIRCALPNTRVASAGGYFAPER